VAEAVIRSLSDKLAIVPLAPLSADQLASPALAGRVASAMSDLAGHFDIVLVDVGCPAEFALAAGATNPLTAAANACVLVHAYEPHPDGNDVPAVDLTLPLIAVVENLARGSAA
jgi:hypothetical protein